MKLYEAIYSHPRDNAKYFVVFLKGWLAQCMGEKVNWTQYAYDSTQLQMKKATRLAFRPKSSHHSLQGSKFTNFLQIQVTILSLTM